MTTCIAIQKEIPEDTVCPLEPGACYWRHRLTGICMQTEDELTVQEFCERVGLKGSPTQAQIEKFKTKLRSVL